MNKDSEIIYSESEINASADRVWRQMAKPGGCVLWHPFAMENTTDGWSGIGSKDEVTYYSGLKVEREVLEWTEGESFVVNFTQEGKNDIEATWKVTALSENRCKFRVSLRVTFIEQYPLILRRLLLRFKLRPVFNRYFDMAMKGFVYHAETGSPVKRNQFGPHPVFSPE